MSVDNLNQEQRDELHEAFSMFDTDSDGAIATKELGTMMRSMGLNPTALELQNMIREVDSGGSGAFHFDGFAGLMSRRLYACEDTEENLLDVFKLMDRDFDGYITAEEARHVLSNLGERLTDAEISDIMTHANVDEHGRVHYEEFVKMLFAM